MAFPTKPENGEIYKDYIYNSSLGAWTKIDLYNSNGDLEVNRQIKIQGGNGLEVTGTANIEDTIVNGILSIDGELRAGNYIMNRTVKTNADEDNMWLLGEWNNSRLNIYGQLLGQRSSNHYDFHRVDFGVSSSSEGMEDNYTVNVSSFSREGDSNRDDSWSLAKVAVEGKDYVALRYNGSTYWASELYFTGYISNTPGISRDDVFKTVYVQDEYTHISTLTTG